MELLLAATINLAMYSNKNNYIGVIGSNYNAIFFLAITIGLPIWIMIFYLCKVNQWEDKEFETKYGSVLEGTRKDYKEVELGKSWIAVLYPVFMLSRRIIFVFTVIFYPKFTWV